MKPDRDDEDWFEALAGRSRPGADPATVLEAMLLRSAVRRWRGAGAADLAPARLAAEEALIRRARAEGLDRRRGLCPGCAERWRAWLQAPWRLGPGLAVTALAALVGIALLLPYQAPDDAPVFRGSEMNGVWLLRDADPKGLRDRIAGDLERAGIDMRRYERLGRFGLEADVPEPPASAALAALRRYGLVAGPDGSLHVEIAATEP